MGDILEAKGGQKGKPEDTGPVVEDILPLPDLSSATPQIAADKFLESEEFYVERGLRVVVETFEQRLLNHNKVNRSVITQEEISQIFLNVSNIYDFNKQLLAELRKLRLDGVNSLLNGLGATMKRFIPFFKLYTAYIKNHRKASKFLADLQLRSKKFLHFVELNNMCAGHTLAALLLVPVTRLPQYLIFLGSVSAVMEQNTQAAKELEAAVNAIQEVTDNIAFFLRDEAARKLVVTIQERIFKNSVDLISPHRYVARHGDLKVVNPKSLFSSRFSQYLFILFNDFILIGTRPGTLFSGKCKNVMRLEGLTVMNESDADDYKHAFRLRGDDQNYLVCAPNQDLKAKWLESIQEMLAEYKKTLSSSHHVMSHKDFDAMIKKTNPKPAAGGAAAPSGASSGPSVGGPGLSRPVSSAPQISSQPSFRQAPSAPSSAPSGPPPPAPPPSGGNNPNIRGDWEKLLDESCGEYYYENLKTGETTWDEPPEFRAPAPAPKPAPPPPAPAAAAAPAIPPRKPAPAVPVSQPSRPAPAAPSIPSTTPRRPAPAAPTGAGAGGPPPPGPPPPGPPSSESRGPPPPPPSMNDAPPPPPEEEPPAPEESPSGGGNDLLSAIRRGKELRKVKPSEKRDVSSAAPGLNNALKDSLNRYRKFVQDDEEEINEKGDDDWAV